MAFFGLLALAASVYWSRSSRSSSCARRGCASSSGCVATPAGRSGAGCGQPRGRTRVETGNFPAIDPETGEFEALDPDPTPGPGRGSGNRHETALESG